MSWRDTSHPDGGGSEVYVEQMAAAAAAHGHRTTLFCASYPGAPSSEERDGYRIVRRGGRFTVYPWAAALYLTGRLGRPDVVIDVQNGVPFGAAAYARRARVLMLVHHVHREHWPVVLGRRGARLGWWVESRLAPRLGRRADYLTVSESTRDELADLGVDPARVRIIHNAIEPAPSGQAPGRSPTPALCVLGRLVPHKRVELALDATARLLPEFPGLTLTVVGQGWWEDRLREHAEALSLTGHVRFTGWVDSADKHDILARSWVMALPSIKEGWGIVVLEAGQHRVPTVAFRSAGGLAESVLDGRTGLLAHDEEAFIEAIRTLLTDSALREELGEQAARHTASFDWKRSVDAFLRILDGAEPDSVDRDSVDRDSVDRDNADTPCQPAEAVPSPDRPKPARPVPSAVSSYREPA
jgi:glycosyltransferase involved in cell wall biosynthesis